MSSPATLFLLPLFAVTFGYEPSPDADTGYDYIVQVEPELVERMHAGDLPAIEANVPPEVTPIRRIRLVIGTDDLPRDLRMTHVSTAESGPVTRTANRENLDGALLAQTGPAGGFGRSSTGFSGQGRTTPAISNQPAAPAVGNSPVDIRRQVESGFENAAQSTIQPDSRCSPRHSKRHRSAWSAGYRQWPTIAQRRCRTARESQLRRTEPTPRKPCQPHARRTSRCGSG